MTVRPLAFACLLLALTASAAMAVRPMSLSDFYGFCSVIPTPETCNSDRVCGEFRRELSSPPQALADCLALCRDTGDRLYLANLVNGCNSTLGRATDLCSQFCRRRAAP